MDQVRSVLIWLKQYHFWVLTGLVALIALACWWSAAGTLSEQYKTNEQKITAEFSSLANVRNNPFQPNEVINELQTTEIEEQSKEVAVIWEKLYERQRENVLTWPPQLSEDFHKHVEKLEFGGDIPTRLRQNYQDYVERHFPDLPEKIGARPMRENEMGQFGGMGMGEGLGRSYRGEGMIGATGLEGDEEDDGDYIVLWLDQAHVREELNFPQTPSAIRIWWTQENLWVYHTLLNVIRNTNEAAGATRMSNAAVRVVYSMMVGQPAAPFSREKDRIVKLATAAPMGGPGEMGEMGMEGVPGMGRGEMGEMPGGAMGGFPGGEMGMGRGMGMSGAPMSPEQEAAMLFSGRYLGEDGRPIAAGGGGGMEGMGPGMDMMADPSAAPPPVDMSSFGKEYKRLPVRLGLQMDQRWLPQLIAECASQPLQVEVQELRINPPGGAGGEGGMGGGFRGFGGGGGIGGSLFPDRTGIQTFKQQPQLVDVVIQGVIFIFKKPDPTLLETPAEAQTAGL